MKMKRILTVSFVLEWDMEGGMMWYGEIDVVMFR